MDAADVFKYLGFEATDETTIDDFKSWSSENFIPASKIGDHKAVKDYVGERIGKLQVKTRQLFKEHGVEFEKGKNKDFEEMLTNGVSSLSGKIGTLNSEIETIKSANPTDSEEVQKLIGEKAILEQKVKDFATVEATYKQGLLDEQAKVKAKETEVKNYIFGEKINEARSGVELDPNADKYKVIGLHAVMEQKYKKTLTETEGENGNTIYGIDIRTLDGEKVQDTNNIGQSLGYQDVFKKEAAEAGLLKVNEDGGKKTQQVNANQKDNQNQENNNTGQRRRVVAQGSQPFVRQ